MSLEPRHKPWELAAYMEGDQRSGFNLGVSKPTRGDTIAPTPVVVAILPQATTSHTERPSGSLVMREVSRY